jgi:hypothetical protein
MRDVIKEASARLAARFNLLSMMVLVPPAGVRGEEGLNLPHGIRSEKFLTARGTFVEFQIRDSVRLAAVGSHQIPLYCLQLLAAAVGTNGDLQHKLASENGPLGRNQIVELVVPSPNNQLTLGVDW